MEQAQVAHQIHCIQTMAPLLCQTGAMANEDLRCDNGSKACKGPLAGCGSRCWNNAI